MCSLRQAHAGRLRKHSAGRPHFSFHGRAGVHLNNLGHLFNGGMGRIAGILRGVQMKKSYALPMPFTGIDSVSLQVEGRLE